MGYSKDYRVFCLENMKKNIVTTLIFIFVVLLLVFAVKGNYGDPIAYQTSKKTNVGGPFESTNTNSRYALVEAIADYGTFFFTDEQAKFSSPDLVLYKGNYFSIFTPGVSFVAVPFYILGKLFELPQLFSFFSTLIFAVLNLYLVAKIGMRLGASKYPALIGGLVFLFGTNALAYSLSLTQHHASTFFILLSVLNAFPRRTWFNNLMLGIIFTAGILMDIPNAFMMVPVMLYAIFKHFQKQEIGQKIKISLRLVSLFLIIGFVPLVFLFGWYNYTLTGSYASLGQTIGRTDYIESAQLREQEEKPKDVNLFDKKQVFNPRDQLNGLYILIVSNERGIFYYSPIVLIGLLGIWVASRKKDTLSAAVVSSSVILTCVVIYSMFGDPWGGWSFGPRYLIPATALLCAGIGVAVQKYKKNAVFILLFSILVIYSVGVSSLGAMTTSAIPPKVEAVALSEPIPYTYKYNLGFVDKNKSSSLLYNVFFYNYISFGKYLIGYIIAVCILTAGLYVLTIRSKKRINFL